VSFELVNQSKFTEKFRSCRETQNLENDTIINREMERLRIEKELLLYKNINTNYKERHNININDEERKKRLLRLKNIILSAAFYFKRLNLTIDEFYEINFKQMTPYELENSKEFLLSVREGDINRVHEYIQKNKRYVFVNDFVRIIYLYM
jgi:hypothetical protein